MGYNRTGTINIDRSIKIFHDGATSHVPELFPSPVTVDHTLPVTMHVLRSRGRWVSCQNRESQNYPTTRTL